MGNQEENVLLRYEGEDAGASSTLEKLVALMQDAVVSVDELVEAGYKMSDITEALDVIAGGASAASEGFGELGSMTKEAALALGQANDILNTGAEAIDTFAKDSLSGAEALGALGQQTSALSKEMDTAWFEVDHGVELLDGLRNAAVGADAVFANFDNQIGLYDEMMSSANDRTNAFTMTVTGAKESTTTLAQAMYDAAAAANTDDEALIGTAEELYRVAEAEGLLVDAVDAEISTFAAASLRLDEAQAGLQTMGEATYILAEQLGVLADAEGQTFEVAQPLVQLTLDWSAAAAVAETSADALTTSFKGTADELAILTDMFASGKFDARGLQQAGYSAEEVHAAFQKLMETGDSVAAAFSLVKDAAVVATNALAKLAIATIENAQYTLDLAEKQIQAAQAAYDMAAAEGLDADTLANLAGGIDSAVASYAKLIGANADLYAAVLDETNALANSAIKLVEDAQATLELAAAKAKATQAAYDMAAAEGIASDVLALLQKQAQAAAEALNKLSDTQKSTASAMSLMGDIASATASAFDTNTLALMQETQVVSDYQSVTQNMTGAMEAATAGMYAQDQAIADATTTYNELDDASATAAYNVEAVGTEAETAGQKVETAGSAFGGSQYLLMQLGFMAFSAAQQFYQLGVTAQDALAIVQGKTGASDAQMQQWTTSLENMGVQGGYSLDQMAQGFDLVTQAQFKGNDGMTVLQASMELARATGEKLTDSTNLLSMSMVSFGAKASDAHTYAAILFDALANGKQTMQQLTSALGPVMGEAAQAGISFNDLVSAERDFSRSTGDSMIATREFQSLIMALAGDTQLTADQLAKLGLAFDQTKFQTLDFAGKLEYLAKYTNGNVQEFIKLVGGTKNVQSAMDALDISTKQLAKNAENLGLSFDPVKYKAMDAGDKLYYLLQVSGYNEAEFKKLTTGGVNPLNAALEKLDLNANDVAAKVKQMGLNFDEAKFQTDNLKQKLFDLWDASGHNIDKFGQLIGGTKNVGAAFDTMGLQADGTGKKQDSLGQKSDDLGNKHLSKSAPIQVHMLDLENHLRNLNDKLDDSGKHVQGVTDKVDAFDRAYGLTAKDVKANTEKVNSSLSDLSLAFTNALASSGLADNLNNLAKAIQYIATQTHAAESFVNAFFFAFLGPTQLAYQGLIALRDQITWLWNLLSSLPGATSALWGQIVQAFSNGGKSVEDQINSLIDWILSKFHFLDFQLVGGSIIPDMIDAITTEFRNAGPSWISAIEGDINGLLSQFTSLPGKMYNWAADAVSQFVSGLLSKLPNVENAASQIAQKVADFLHHSTPSVGPMAGDDQWMPDFMTLLETGINSNISRLAHASAQVAQSLIPPVGLSTSSSPFSSQQSVAPIVTVLNQILAVLQSGQSGRAGSGAPPSVTLNTFGGGSTNVGQIANQLDQLQGIRLEAGLRGGF